MGNQVTTTEKIVQLTWRRFVDGQTPPIAQPGAEPLKLYLNYGEEGAEPHPFFGCEEWKSRSGLALRPDGTLDGAKCVGINHDMITRYREETGVNLHEVEDAFIAALYGFLAWLRDKGAQV